MIILIQCRDQIGLVAAISSVLARERLNIVSLREHVDKTDNRFFMRVQIEQETEPGALYKKLQDVLPTDADISVNPLPEKKIVVMVTKEYHCLADILIRNHFKTLGAAVQCVIGNHATLQNICDRFDISFYEVNGNTGEKTVFEENIITIVKKYNPDYIVLAKFMRILSPEFLVHFPGRIVNIHHSFLPAFAGASPYKQAYERGVKMIGATAHFVTDQLDEGPIIAQQIISVNHSHTASDMMKAGKDIETSVLARALRLLFDDRVFVYKNKTVVFE